MKTCRVCDKIYSGWKCICGFREPFSKTMNQEPINHSVNCSWIDQGLSCQKLATMSDHPYAGVSESQVRQIYCPYHYEVKVNPHFLSDKNQVEAFFKRIKSYEKQSIHNSQN